MKDKNEEEIKLKSWPTPKARDWNGAECDRVIEKPHGWMKVRKGSKKEFSVSLNDLAEYLAQQESSEDHQESEEN